MIKTSMVVMSYRLAHINYLDNNIDIKALYTAEYSAKSQKLNIWSRLCYYKMI